MKLASLQSMREEWLNINSSKRPTSLPKGFSIIEILLAGSIFISLVTMLVGGYLYGQESTVLSGNRASAIFIAEEGLEAVRNIRDEDFLNLNDGTHGLSISGDEWTFSGSSDITDIYTRTITIASLDTHKKSITSNVVWKQNEQRDGSVSLVTYLSEWMRESIIAGDWANATTSAIIDLDTSTNALKVQVQGDYVYLIKQGGAQDFIVIDVSNPNNPSIEAILDIPNNPSDIAISGDYAFVTTTNDSSELIIINISNPSSPSIAGTYNSPGNTNGLGIHVSGSTAYLAKSNGNDEFEIINISSISSPTRIGFLNLNGQANDIAVSGNYAFVGVNNLGEEFQVINISNPAAPVKVAFRNLPGTSSGLTIAMTGNTILLGQGNFLHLIDVSTPTSPSVIGAFNAGDVVSDVAIDLANSSSYVFISTNSNSAEFQIVNISNLSLPVLLKAIDVPTNENLTGVAYDETLDTAFSVGASNTQEFLIFRPQ